MSSTRRTSEYDQHGAEAAAATWASSGPRRKVLTVIGTRPEAIKMVPLVRALKESNRCEPVVIATGQHPGMVQQVLAAAGLGVDADLEVGRPGLTLNELFSAVLCGLERFCIERYGPPNIPVRTRVYNLYPAACVVHGDTSSAAAAALAAFHLQIPVAHVEAGLRTSNTLSPFPEEANRQLISRIASFHLAPTYVNMANLLREGIPGGRVFVTGNTAIDALQWAADQNAPYQVPELDWLEGDEETPVVVVTAHRRENWGEGLDRIGTAVARLTRAYPQVRFVLPLHPNPAVAGPLRTMLHAIPNISLVSPLPYLTFARLLGRARFAISDSGGVQEEAPALGTPVLVVRESTERQEGVDAGTLELVGTDIDRIVTAASALLDDPELALQRCAVNNPYGDGQAARRIVEAFEHVAFDAPEPVPYSSGFNRIEVLRTAGFDEDPSAVFRPTAGRGMAEPPPKESAVEEMYL